MSQESDTYYNSLIEDDDDDARSKKRVKILILLAFAASQSIPRESFHVRDRLEWNAHVNELHMESPQAFYQLYRMNLASFNKLCAWIDPLVKVDPVMSSVRTGKSPIATELALHCLLRWLAGGSHLDIRISAGISISSFYGCVHKCIHAIRHCHTLDISFPDSEDDVSTAAQNFQQISSAGIIDGCVGCLDGMLLRIQTPSTDETGHVMSYYSGHYADYGINIQAACDSACRFIFVGVSAPGGASDLVAFRRTALCQMIDDLPLGRYVLADNAYVCTEHLLTPFPGEQRRQPQNDSYNYHLSQLRMRIEMTFGQFVNKWRLFKRPLQVKLKNAGKVFMCASRLHNFCINERLSQGIDATTMDDEDNVGVFIPSDPTETVAGNSMMRDILVDQIYHSGLSRPAANRQRNRAFLSNT